MRRIVAAAATLAMLGVLLGCNKSPTEPESSNQFGVVGGFQCLDGARIQQFQLLLDDGAVIQDVSFSPATNVVTVNGQKRGVPAGSHTLSLKIVRQSVSPSRYYAFVSVLVLDSMGRTTNEITLPDQTKPLATGESISYTVTTR